MELRNEIEIDATAEQVWDVLGDLAGTDEWLPGVIKTEVDGSTRVCTMADGSEIKEEISAYDPERHTFRFRHLQVPMPVEESGGSFLVEAEPTRVVLESSFRPLDPAVGPMIEGAFQQALESLKRRVEEGVRWNGPKTSRPG
jgi:uncharacterized protein YndB with AHSA1/START domain